MLTDTQLAKLRSRFPILREKTYLYNCSQGALSDAVEEAMQVYIESWRKSVAPWEEWIGVYEELRRDFARFINADPDEIAIINSASAGINPIANAISFEGRNQVVMSEYEFPTMGQIWLAQTPRGAQVRFLEGANNAMTAEDYDNAIGERTRIVPVSQVSFLNGARPDIEAITRIAHRKGVQVFLDGYQDCGTRPLDVKALGVDYYVTGTLKYLLGPPGLGFLYVRREWIETLSPTITSWMAQRDAFAFQTQVHDPSPTARRFECGSPAIPNIYMARAALRLLSEVGMENVAWQIERLTRAFLTGARDLEIASKTPASSVGPLVVLRSNETAAVLAKLAERGIAASARRDGVRFAFHVYNTLDDVKVALAAVAECRDLMVRV